MNRDPKAGCIIMLVGALIFGGLIAYTITLPFRQSGLMQEFTQHEAVELETGKTLEEPPKMLKGDLEDFQLEIQERDELVSISFTAAQLNDAIRSFDEFNELQGTFAIKEITPQAVLCDISFPLRAAPFSDEVPYLNGVMHAEVVAVNDEIVLDASKIEVESGAVPEGFLNHFKPYRIMSPYSEHGVMGRAMFACEEVLLAQDSITLKINPEKFNDPEAIEPEENNEEKNKKRMIVMTICSFLLVGAIFMFLVNRRNNESAKALQEEE